MNVTGIARGAGEYTHTIVNSYLRPGRIEIDAVVPRHNQTGTLEEMRECCRSAMITDGHIRRVPVRYAQDERDQARFVRLAERRLEKQVNRLKDDIGEGKDISRVKELPYNDQIALEELTAPSALI